MPTATPFNNLITFSRGSNATVTGSNGLIQWAPNNLLTFSESFDAAAWVKTNATVYPNQDFGNGTLGPELVTNGDFATDTAWTKPVNGTISGGSANFAPGGGATANFQQSASGLTNVFVRVQFSVSNFVAGSVALRIGASGGITKTIDAVANGTYSEILQVNGSLTFFQLLGNNSSNLSVDNVSVREITPAAATAPDGTQTADTLFVPATGVQTILTLNPGATLGLPYTASIYVKRVNSDWFALSNQTFFAYFNLSGAGSVGTVGEGSASITSVGDGWFRITWSGSVAWSTAIRVRAVTADNNPAVVAGQQYLIWGAQLELGSTATTYNPTTVKNLLGFSEAFDNAGWSKLNTSIVTGAQANPVNGLFNAQKLMEDTANAQHIVQQGFSVLSGTPYVFSVYAKAAGRNRFSFRFGSIAPADSVTFDLSNGTIVTGTAGYVASIVSIGSGWYRCSITSTPSSSGTRQHQIYLNSTSGSGAETYTGDGNSGVYIYGAQLSDSASLDPYVPTPGAAPSSTAFYGPRFDFDPVTLQPRGLLVEEQRTNLLVRSEEIDNASWTKNNTTVVANNITAPDGTMTADRVTPTASSTTHLVRQGPTTTAVVHAQTVFYKPSGYTKVAIREDFAVGQYASFSCVGAGSIINKTAAASAEIVALQNGWYRLTLVPTTTTANQGMGVYIMADGYTTGDPAGYSYAGDGVSGGFIWGGQLEIGAFATSYIPTVASTVTRSADVATINGSLFSQWYSQTAGSFVAEWALANANTTGRYIVKAFSPSVAQGYGLWVNSNSIDTRAWIGATSITAGNASLTVANKASMGYRAGDNAASVNGAAAVTSSATGPTDATYLEIGSAGASYLNGHIRNIRFIPARAADFQLQGLST